MVSSFRTNLEQHLAELDLELSESSPQTVGAQQLGALGRLKALRRLQLGWGGPSPACLRELHPYRNMAGEKLCLKLPHLVSLRLSTFKQCEILVSSPKLAEVQVYDTESLHIVLEACALEDVTLMRCESIQLTRTSPQQQLQNMKCLLVTDSCEVGRHLIEDISHMRDLQELYYFQVPAECMPGNFPERLRRVRLHTTDWCYGLPGGLKDLPVLEHFHFYSDDVSWRITQPLAELLPLDNLDSLSIGVGIPHRTCEYESKRCGGKGFSEHLQLELLEETQPYSRPEIKSP